MPFFLSGRTWVGMDDSVTLGLGSDVPARLHLVRQTLELWRARLGLTDRHVPILEHDIGLFCLDLTRVSAGDCPIVCYYEHDPAALRD